MMDWRAAAGHESRFAAGHHGLSRRAVSDRSTYRITVPTGRITICCPSTRISRFVCRDAWDPEGLGGSRHSRASWAYFFVPQSISRMPNHRISSVANSANYLTDLCFTP